MIGLVLRATRNVVNVTVHHRDRQSGTSGYTFGKLLALWFNGFTAFSEKPLRIATLVGVFCAMAGFLYGIYTVIKKLVLPGVPIGFSALMSSIMFIGGMLMLMLGLIGEYVGRMYICINNAPQFVIREVVGGDEDEKERRAKRMTGKLKEPGVWCCAGAGALFVGFCSQWGSQLDNIGNVDVRAVSCMARPSGGSLYPDAGPGCYFCMGRNRGGEQVTGTKSDSGEMGKYPHRGMVEKTELFNAAAFACCSAVCVLVSGFSGGLSGVFCIRCAAELDEVVTGGYVDETSSFTCAFAWKNSGKVS